MTKTKLTLLFEGQKLELKSGFVGGFVSDFTESPMGMYIGTLDVADTNLALVHLLRAVIKMNTEEHGLTINQSHKLIEFALKHAIKKEKENKNIDNVSLEQHQEVLLKVKRDNMTRGE